MIKFVMMSGRDYLTEQEKIKMIHMVYVHGLQWKFVSETIGHPYEAGGGFTKVISNIIQFFSNKEDL